MTWARWRSPGARVVAGALALALSSGALVACGGSGSDDDAAAPNFVFIVTDDMAVADLAAMPELQRWVGEQGTTFTRAYVSVPLCCPSRTTMLRGQYAHNTGIESNEGLNGGFPAVYRGDLEASTVATWLDDGGYRTGLFGKYLNFYPEGASPTYVPPGWDEWASPVLSSDEGFDYTLNDDGRLTSFGDDPEDYAASVYVDRTAALATRAAEADEPFFAWLAVDAPHEPATPAPQDADAYAGETAPRGESFDVIDPSAPSWVRDLPSLSQAQLDEIDDRHRSRLASLRSLDRELGRLADVLEENGQLDDTYVVFTSDNGFHLGQHRLKAGKQTAYEEDVRVPLLVRGPGVPAGEESDVLVVNVDLAPTFAALAGVEVPDFVDGRDLGDLWRGEADDGSGRGAVLLEHWPPVGTGAGATTPAGDTATSHASTDGPSTGGTSTPPTAGPSTVATSELDSDARSESPAPPTFTGVRTDRYTYVEYVTGEVELYDNRRDPAQVHNLAAGAPAALLDRLAALVAALADCAGPSCREAEAVTVP